MLLYTLHKNVSLSFHSQLICYPDGTLCNLWVSPAFLFVFSKPLVNETRQEILVNGATNEPLISSVGVGGGLSTSCVPTIAGGD